ncbi:MAG: Hcp family type VI secretion system effector [Myxococcota bacterium]
MAGYIRFDGIEGEAEAKGYEGWSRLHSVAQVIHRSGAEGVDEDAVLEDLLVAKRVDVASPLIAQAICEGRVFPKVEIHLTRTGKEGGEARYFTWVLEGARVVDYSVGGRAERDEHPVEEISLAFDAIRGVYTRLDAQGKARGEVAYRWPAGSPEQAVRAK